MRDVPYQSNARECNPEDWNAFQIDHFLKNSDEESSESWLEFAIFCVESVAERLGVTGPEVYKALTEESNILVSYIVPLYGVLHTQGKSYIVDDILEVMEKRGIRL